MLQSVKCALGLMTGLVVCIGMLSGLGCAHYRAKEIYHYDANGQPFEYKRLERYPQRDFIHHATRTVYGKISPDYLPYSCSDQAALLQEWGNPDWIRKPFVALEGHWVEEWLYQDQNILFQFIGDKKVYEGPIMDLERTLLLRGYPDRAIVSRNEMTTGLQIYVYDRLFSPAIETFQFVKDGKLTFSEEGN